MAIGFRAATSFAAGNGTSIPTLAKPTGTAIDDLLVVSFYGETGGAAGALSIASTSDIWTLVHSITNTTPTPDFEHWVWIAKAISASSTIGITWDGDNFWRDACVLGFTGVDTTTPQDAAATENSGNSATPTGLGIAEVTADSWPVMLEANFDGNARSASSLTERHDNENVSAFASLDATGTNKVCTITSSQWTAIMLRLRPAGAVAAPRPKLYVVNQSIGRAALH